jgi:membrane protease subunit (stomatin/prohibitin family)
MGQWFLLGGAIRGIVGIAKTVNEWQKEKEAERQAQERQRQKEIQKEIDDHKIVCSVCGSEASPGDKFCKACGSKELRQNIRRDQLYKQYCQLSSCQVCIPCNELYFDNRKFCGKCGKEVRKYSQQEIYNILMKEYPELNNSIDNLEEIIESNSGS